MKKTELEDFLALQLEDRSFDEILEDYDLDPYTVFWNLYQAGFIDEEILESRNNAY